MTMKILPVSLIRDADAYTIGHEPISEIDLMERAASACVQWLEKHLDKGQKILIFSGSGNNGGDGLVIARMLLLSGFRIEAFVLHGPEKMTPSCLANYERLLTMQPMPLHLLSPSLELPAIGKTDIIIDALFGSGLTRPPDGFSVDLIRHINSSGARIVAIDVPSGLFCDATSVERNNPPVIRADYTLTFSPPKLAFFFPENDAFVGEWQLLDIGIMQDFIEAAAVNNIMLDQPDMKYILRKRNKFSHKGNFGHTLLICGSLGKMGAAILSARACLRSGSGLVTVHLPKSGVPIVQTAVPEAMVSIDQDEHLFTASPDLSAYSAIAIGPGIGTSQKTAAALKILIQNSSLPILFDADAINLLSENKTWLGFIPRGSIFTPHPKEFERLAGKSSNNFDRNRMQLDFSVKHQCYIVLKGAHTAITTPDGRCYFNSTGNPGMATGGSGDVLTGIIAGLQAQGYSALESCLLGVYLHGLSGDIAASEEGYEAMIANDIILNLGKSFQTLYGKF
jgi:NAD(P)H-hydrate epimerase